MTQKELYELINNTLAQGPGGSNFIGQIRNANHVSRTVGDAANSVVKPLKANAAVGIGMSALNGIAGVAGNVSKSVGIADTSDIENQINSIADKSLIDYSDYDQMIQGMTDSQVVPDIQYRDIRGMNDMQKAMSIGSSVLTGASAGNAIGGPWGAAVGAAVGVGAGIGGVIAGNEKTRAQTGLLKLQAENAEEASSLNFTSTVDKIRERNTRYGFANSAREGGHIYTASTPGKKNFGTVSTKERLTHWHADGGTIVRIKTNK